MMNLTPQQNTAPRGFTLLIAIILASVALALSLSLIDISYKQVLLSISVKQSQYAFAAADSGLECALYYDQKQDSFSFVDAPISFSVMCGGLSASVNYPANSSERTATFSVPCASGGSSASVTVVKSSDASTKLYSDGYSSCSSSDTRRVERGLKASY